MPRIQKIKADTVSAALKAHAQAREAILPPAVCRMRDIDMPYWRSIVSSKSPDEWTEPDLILAAGMARAMADVEVFDGELLNEPSVINNKPNPKITIVETLTNRVMRISRALQINARANNGEVRNLKKGRENHRQASNTSADGLIKYPDSYNHEDDLI
jgi:hypothetical protein